MMMNMQMIIFNIMDIIMNLCVWIDCVCVLIMFLLVVVDFVCVKKKYYVFKFQKLNLDMIFYFIFFKIFVLK